MKTIKIIDIQKICNGCKFNLPSLCDKGIQDIVSCEEGKEDASVIEQVPETLEDIKDLLDELKIEHESIYVNDKDVRWTEKDKIKILRAINIKFKMNYCYPLTDITITINDCNEIGIRKYRYDGQEYMMLQFSTTEQVWNIFINIYKDAIKERDK